MTTIDEHYKVIIGKSDFSFNIKVVLDWQTHNTEFTLVDKILVT